jgi:hypothetical protein
MDQAMPLCRLWCLHVDDPQSKAVALPKQRAAWRTHIRLKGPIKNDLSSPPSIIKADDAKGAEH